MASVSIYLNFQNQAEEAFNFYKKVFQTEFSGIQRFSEMKDNPDAEKLTEEEKNGILHVSLPITGGMELMGSDVPSYMGRVTMGNNVYINLMPDTRAEADRLFKELSTGGQIEMEMQEMFWGDYFGSFTDKFGVKWMVDTDAK